MPAPDQDDHQNDGQDGPGRRGACRDDELDEMDAERARWAQLRDEVALIRRAATQLRRAATQATYRGARHPERAYAVASILDLAATRWPDQHPTLRAALRDCALILLTDPDTAEPASALLLIPATIPRTHPARPTRPADPDP